MSEKKFASKTESERPLPECTSGSKGVHAKCNRKLLYSLDSNKSFFYSGIRLSLQGDLYAGSGCLKRADKTVIITNQSTVATLSSLFQKGNTRTRGLIKIVLEIYKFIDKRTKSAAKKDRFAWQKSTSR